MLGAGKKRRNGPVASSCRFGWLVAVVSDEQIKMIAGNKCMLIHLDRGKSGK